MLKLNTRVICRPDGSVTDTLECPAGATRLLVREDRRRIEALCEHGVGHCIASIGPWENWMGTHGCDGCCAAFVTPPV